MANSFQIGDVVQLKSGGPKMTIVAVPSGDGRPYMATWLQGRRKKSGPSPPRRLFGRKRNDRHYHHRQRYCQVDGG